MSADNAALPAGFAALEPFVSIWAVDGTAERAALRHLRTAEERQAFYEATKDALIPALDYLDDRPLSALNAAERRLMNLVLAFAHVTLAIDGQGPDEDRHAASRVAFTITRSTADTAA
jgi:hypothetical protein